MGGTLCCEPGPGASSAPPSLVRDDCALLRRALLLGHAQGMTEPQTRALHQQLLPRTHAVGAAVMAQLDQQLRAVCRPRGGALLQTGQRGSCKSKMFQRNYELVNPEAMRAALDSHGLVLSPTKS